MKKFVPLSKQSKAVKKKHAAAQRRTWEDVRPTLRIVESRKCYSRKRLPNPNADE